MGTKDSLQKKMEVAFAIIKQCEDKEVDIDKENLYSLIMVETYCERRKAKEIVQALMIKFPCYKDAKNNYLFQRGNSSDAQTNTE